MQSEYPLVHLIHILFYRLPLEILRHGEYTKEGDVYMLAMAIYEFYMGLEINLENPTSSFMECVPLCRVPRQEVIFIVTSFIFSFNDHDYNYELNLESKQRLYIFLKK